MGVLADGHSVNTDMSGNKAAMDRQPGSHMVGIRKVWLEVIEHLLWA